MRSFSAREWVGIGLFVAGAGFLVTSMLIGTGLNIITAIGIMFSGALTHGAARWGRQQTAEQDRTDAVDRRP